MVYVIVIYYSESHTNLYSTWLPPLKLMFHQYAKKKKNDKKIRKEKKGFPQFHCNLHEKENSLLIENLGPERKCNSLLQWIQLKVCFLKHHKELRLG